LKLGDLLPFRVKLFYNQPHGDFNRYVSPHLEVMRARPRNSLR
jgi:hypothetical protein